MTDNATLLENTEKQIAEKINAFPQAKREELLKKVRDKLEASKIRFVTERKKLLKDLCAGDLLPGLEPEDVALDSAPDGEELENAAEDVMEMLKSLNLALLEKTASVSV